HVAVLRIAVRIMRADVAQRRGAQQRVADGMQQHVGVRMPLQALVMRNVDAADHEFPARDQRVHVESLPDPHLFSRIACAIFKSSAKVTLMFSRLPVTRRGRNPICSTAPASSVTAVFAFLSASISRPKRNICGVCASQTWLRSSVAATRCTPASS